VDTAVANAEGGGVDELEGEIIDVIGHAPCKKVGQASGGLRDD